MPSRQQRETQLGQYEIPAFAAATVAVRQERIKWFLAQAIELMAENDRDISRWMQTAQGRTEYPEYLRRSKQ